MKFQKKKELNMANYETTELSYFAKPRLRNLKLKKKILRKIEQPKNFNCSCSRHFAGRHTKRQAVRQRDKETDRETER